MQYDLLQTTTNDFREAHLILSRDALRLVEKRIWNLNLRFDHDRNLPAPSRSVNRTAHFLTSRLFPVICAGCGRPSISRRVGAMSARMPLLTL